MKVVYEATLLHGALLFFKSLSVGYLVEFVCDGEHHSGTAVADDVDLVNGEIRIVVDDFIHYITVENVVRIYATNFDVEYVADRTRTTHNMATRTITQITADGVVQTIPLKERKD